MDGEVNRKERESEDGTEPETTARLYVYRVIPADMAPDVYTSEMHIRLTEEQATDDRLRALFAICDSAPGETPVVFAVTCANGDRIFLANDDLRVKNDLSLRTRVTALLGDECLHFKPSRVLLKNPSNRGIWRQRREN